MKDYVQHAEDLILLQSRVKFKNSLMCRESKKNNWEY